jgi:hypothetical protein
MQVRGTIIILSFLLMALVVYSLSTTSGSSHHPMLTQVRNNFSKIDPKFANIPLRTGDSAYTENKAVITLCLTDPGTNKHYDINTIMYVALHELAHVITPEGAEEHGTEFKKNFSSLLNKAAMIGVYDPSRSIPTTYCKVHTN